MKSILFVVETRKIRSVLSKPSWLASAIRSHAPGWAKETLFLGTDHPELDSVALLYQGKRVAVVLFLGPYYSDEGRVSFCLHDLTVGDEFVEAARKFSAASGNILHEVRCA